MAKSLNAASAITQLAARLNPVFSFVHQIFNSNVADASIMMIRTLSVLLLALGAQIEARPAQQNDAFTSYRDTHQGTVKPLQSIEASVVPNMKRQGASYIGAEYNAQSLQYRLKFMNDGSVIWIDVDGRNGNVIGQAGH